MPSNNQENQNPHSSRASSGRTRRPTQRADSSRKAALAKVKAAKDKKSKFHRRKALKDRQNEAALTVERPGDNTEVRKLRAALVRTQGERDAAEAAIVQPPRRRGPAPRSIERPANMNKVTVANIREHLGIVNAKHDQEWNNIRSAIRRYMDAGLLDRTINWKGQDTHRLLKLYDAIEESYPELQRFHGQWAAAFLVYDSFRAQKTYSKCNHTEGTYRYRARMRRSRCSRHDSEEGEWAGIGPLAPSRSPSPDNDGTTETAPVNRRSQELASPSDADVNPDQLPELTPEPE